MYIGSELIYEFVKKNKANISRIHTFFYSIIFAYKATFIINNYITYKMLREKYTRIGEIPFDSDRKLMSTVNKIDDCCHFIPLYIIC